MEQISGNTNVYANNQKNKSFSFFLQESKARKIEKRFWSDYKKHSNINN
jgi:hypothetical protein